MELGQAAVLTVVSLPLEPLGQLYIVELSDFGSALLNKPHVRIVALGYGFCINRQLHRMVSSQKAQLMPLNLWLKHRE